MSADVLACVQTFFTKAEELVLKGHVLRAAENFGRAAEAAVALGADNLVTVEMQLRQGLYVLTYSYAAPDATSAQRGLILAYRTEYVALFSSAVEALELRRAAGTLLAGKCSAVEEAWCARQLRREHILRSAAETAGLAALAGYAQFVRAASLALNVLMLANMGYKECSEAQLLSFARHVVHAVELMLQPRRPGGATLAKVETDVTELLRTLFPFLDDLGQLDARLVQLLLAAWQQLQSSGVLQARRAQESIAKQPHEAEMELAVEAEFKKVEAAFNKSVKAPGRRRCALAGCGTKEAHPAHFKSCAACRIVVYCSKECQAEDWASHKKACKAARKAAAEEEADGGAGPSGA